MDFQEVKQPLRTKSVRRPIKVGKRPITERKLPIKAMVLVGISVGCLMGCFGHPRHGGKTAPLKRPIERSMTDNHLLLFTPCRAFLHLTAFSTIILGSFKQKARQIYKEPMPTECPECQCTSTGEHPFFTQHCDPRVVYLNSSHRAQTPKTLFFAIVGAFPTSRKSAQKCAQVFFCTNSSEKKCVFLTFWGSSWKWQFLHKLMFWVFGLCGSN